MPGAVAGWQALHDRFGKLSLAEDLKPAMALGREWIPSDGDRFGRAWKRYGMPFVDRPAFASVFLPNGTYPKVGEIFRIRTLAASLRLVGERGVTPSIRARSRQSILKLSQEQGGFLTAEDLADFQPEWVEPVSTTYHGWTIYETPPNSQGIAALIDAEHHGALPLARVGPRRSADAAHRTRGQSVGLCGHAAVHRRSADRRKFRRRS